ncbi:MAG: VUT family protein [Hyphomonas sp.]
MSELVAVLTNGQPQLIGPALGALLLTFFAIWFLNGRIWAFIYVALIPFLNWSFGVIPEAQILAPGGDYAPGIALHPMTMVTGMVFVVRDFVQREMGHKVLILMAIAVAWSFFYSWPVIALASGIAFAISEFVDWLVYTFTKYRLSTRILISSALASPVDTTIFLYGADLAKQIEMGAEPGNMLHPVNWIVFVIGKMVGAVIVSYVIRRREDQGLISPYEA